MCLTGVDYFSTLGYQPGIVVVAAGMLAPVATLILVAVTMLGVENSSSWCSFGFAVTDFIITMARSVADASAHITLSTESPRVLPLTIALFTALAVVFYRGFSEAIGVSILLVIAYLLLNIIVIAVGLTHIAKAMAAQMASAAKSTATNACSSLSQRS